MRSNCCGGWHNYLRDNDYPAIQRYKEFILEYKTSIRFFEYSIENNGYCFICKLLAFTIVLGWKIK